MFTYEQIFLVFYWLVMANLVVGVPVLLILGLLIPKSLKAEYFRAPYYKNHELRWLSIFPLSAITYAALACMFVWPRLGKKRGIVAQGGELTFGYRLGLQLYFWATTVTVSIALILLLVLYLA